MQQLRGNRNETEWHILLSGMQQPGRRKDQQREKREKKRHEWQGIEIASLHGSDRLKIH